jgi:hypothetical protein
MCAAYTYVEGEHLAQFILAVREEFVKRDPCEPKDSFRPNALRIVAIDLFEGRSTDEQLRLLRDLLTSNPELVIERNSREVFAHSDTPSAYITDCVCEVAHQVLARDPTIRAEEDRRLELAAALSADGDEPWAT